MNMNDFFKKYTKQSKKGFTMVEMIAVIIIMSIISTATVSIFLSVQTTVSDTKKLTIQQYAASQMEKFFRNEFQTASKIDVKDLAGDYPENETYMPNNGFVHYDPSTGHLIFSLCNSSGEYKTDLIIDEVEDVVITICPVDTTAADPTNMSFKLIYKVTTKSYTYSGGIVLGNSHVGDSDTFESAHAMNGDYVATVHWRKDPDTDTAPDTDTDLDDVEVNNGTCITYYSLGSQKDSSDT